MEPARSHPAGTLSRIRHRHPSHDTATGTDVGDTASGLRLLCRSDSETVPGESVGSAAGGIRMTAQDATERRAILHSDSLGRNVTWRGVGGGTK